MKPLFYIETLGTFRSALPQHTRFTRFELGQYTVTIFPTQELGFAP